MRKIMGSGLDTSGTPSLSDLLLCGFYLFRPLEGALGSPQFDDDRAVKEYLGNCPLTQPTSFYIDRIKKLPIHWKNIFINQEITWKNSSSSRRRLFSPKLQAKHINRLSDRSTLFSSPFSATPVEPGGGGKGRGRVGEPCLYLIQPRTINSTVDSITILAMKPSIAQQKQSIVVPR